MKRFVLLCSITLAVPSFASVHFVSQTLKPTAKLALDGAKVGSFPVRHPVKSAKGFGKGVASVTKTVF